MVSPALTMVRAKKKPYAKSEVVIVLSPVLRMVDYGYLLARSNGANNIIVRACGIGPRKDNIAALK